MGLVAKAFQDIITFSRATQTGTYVNSSGYITNASVLNYLTYSNAPENAAWTKSNSFVQQNLLLQSEDFSTTWSGVNILAFGSGSTVNATIAPNGTMTADLVIASTTPAVQHRLDQTPVSAAGPQTFSVYLKYFGYQWASLRIGSSSATGAAFDILNGVVGVGGGATRSIQSVGNGWYRCVITVASALANDICRINIEDTDNVATNFAGTGTTGLYAWGAQLVQGSVAGDYRATTSAALPCLYADYNGNLRARKLCENNAATIGHRVQQGTASLDGSNYTISAKLKAGERTWAYLRFDDGVGTLFVWFNLATGAVGSTVVSGSTTISGSATSAGNGYFNCVAVISNTSVSTKSVAIGPATGDANQTYTGDGSSGIYIADAQLNDGSSATAYYETTQYAYNAPRLDYDPVTLAPKGLLVEAARTNYMTRSSDFSNSVWTNAAPNNPTVTADAILAPDGTISGDLLTAATGGVASQARQVAATGTTGDFVGSVFLKAGSAARTRIILVDSTTVFTVIGDFQVAWTAGVASVFSTASGTASIVSAGNGWYRCIITASTASANAIIGFAIHPDPVAGTGTVYAWNGQVEAGTLPTSVIPTTASQVTRAVDVASVNTLSPWYNSVAGTLYVEYDVPGVAGTMPIRALAAFSDGTTSNRIYEYLSASSLPNLQVTDAGVSQASISNSAISANVTVKTAASFTLNDFAIVTNGGTVATDVAGTNPTAITKLELGALTATSTYLSGHLRRITYYPRRLTNAELQTLTTL